MRVNENQVRAEMPMYHPNALRRLGYRAIVGWCFAMLMLPDATGQGRADVVAGIDHVPIAVANLDSAAANYARMGFALKPGRPHDNGIRNVHIKFQDGTELELITASEARDDLTREYRAFLEHGDGPAFVALFAPNKERLSKSLDAAGLAHSVGWGVTFAQDHPLRYLFFGPRNASPTDKAEHFQHANGAQSLIGVWLAADIRDVESSLFAAIGLQPQESRVLVPDTTFARLAFVDASVANFAEGTLTFLPKHGALETDAGPRRIVGVTLACPNLDEARRVLEDAGLAGKLLVMQNPPDTRSRRSLFVHPDDAHGLWVEFREVP